MRIIHVLRKPLSEGTVASNVLKHGCGGLNIAASRIGTSTRTNASKSGKGNRDVLGPSSGGGGFTHGTATVVHNHGRWPANVILHRLGGPGCPVARLDGQTEPTKSKRSMRGVGWSDSEVFGSGDPAFDTSRGFDDAGGVSRFYKQVGGQENEDHSCPTKTPL